MKTMRFCLLLVVIFATVLLAACGAPAAAPTTTPIPPTPVPPTATSVPPTATAIPQETAQEDAEADSLGSDAPEYAIGGPYAVGVRNFTIPAENDIDRDLIASLWYPALNPDNTAGEMVYTLNFEPGDFPLLKVIGHAIQDADIDTSGAPYPLVVHSHAHMSFSQELPYLVEHLASRGFVVIAVDHEDNWSTAFGPLDYQAMLRRPQEITRQIDYAESLSAPAGRLPGMIDTEKVGVTGWSLGGTTALAAGGARMNLGEMRTWCKENPKGAALSEWACVDILDHEAELAAFAGLDQTPTGLWADWGDERVGAVIPLASATIPFGSEGIGYLDVPVMFMVGSDDTAKDPYFEMAEPYESVTSERKAKVVFEQAGHMLFNASCEDAPTIVDLGFSMFCSDPVWDMDQAHNLINHFTTAFLLAELKGDSGAAAVLAPEAVDFEGIEYQAEGFEAGMSPAAELDSETVDKIEALVEDMIDKHDLPGFALAIVKDGDLAYANGFGVANVDTGVPVTSRTLFMQGELTFTPTAMAILQLVDQGKIDLDAPVTDYLPYFEMGDERYQDITVGQILNNTSGIPDSGDAMADWANATPEFNEGATERWVRSLSDERLLFAPGSACEGSDKGFAILGDVIAKVSGQSYEEYIAENILTPLGMSDSTALLSEADEQLLASSHIPGAGGQRVVSGVMPYHRAFAAGNNLFSNVEDMAKLAQVSLNRGKLAGERILSEAAVDEMWKAQARTPYGAYPFGTVYPSKLMVDYGYGWFVGDVLGHPAYMMFGREYGLHSGMTVVPDENLAVVAMGNGPVDRGYYAADITADVMGTLLNQ